MKLKALSLALIAAFATPAFAEVKIALDSKPDPEFSGSYKWALTFGEALKAAGMDVREMPRGSVGNEAEKLDQLSTGLLEVSLSDVRTVASIEPFMYGVRLPYIFDDFAHMERTLAEGDVYGRVNEALAGQDIMLVAFAPLGPSSGIITTTTPVRKPEDMSNLRMRALDDAQLAMFEAWGTKGTIVPWAEVPAGLQTGVIDGYLNSPFVPITFGQTDFVKNFSDAGVLLSLRAILFSKIWYDDLSDDERAAVDAAVETANVATREWLAASSESSLAALEKAGVTVQRLSEEERAMFRERSQAVYNSGVLPADDVAAWVALSEKAR